MITNHPALYTIMCAVKIKLWCPMFPLQNMNDLIITIFIVVPFIILITSRGRRLQNIPPEKHPSYLCADMVDSHDGSWLITTHGIDNTVIYVNSSLKQKTTGCNKPNKKKPRLCLWNMVVHVLDIKKRVKKKARKNNRQNLGNVQKHEQSQEINR